jgi:hypothetical protein
LLEFLGFLVLCSPFGVVFEGFAYYAAKQKFTLAKGTHASLSYAENGTSGHFLVRVWKPESPARKDPASAYTYDPYAGGGFAIDPYPTPEDLTTTVDLTES